MLNRPTKSNAMNKAFWRDMLLCFRKIRDDATVKAVVITGAGKNFTAGLDLMDAGVDFGTEDVGRKAYALRDHIMELQESFNAIEDCAKPVIIAVHGACYGGGIDLMCAADIRLCTKDTRFSIKEVDVGLAADIGTLQRLPKIVGNDSLARELAFTARPFSAEEAAKMGFVSRVFEGGHKDVVDSALATARVIASKSPVAVLGTKHLMNYSRDHTVAEGLHYTAIWNGSMIQSKDLEEAMGAFLKKKKPRFSKL